MRAFNPSDADNDEDFGSKGPANLVRYPPDLCNLWNECEGGVGGNKSAREFAITLERGKVKSKYCMRKKFWKAMEMSIAGGYCNQKDLWGLWTE